MNKLRKKCGMTLMEMLASLLVLTLLVTAMGTGMDSAGRIYREAAFASDSAALATIVNTALGDVLRYAEDIRVPEAVDAAGNPVDEAVGFVFSNQDYGLRDVYFQTKTGDDDTGGILTLRSLRLEAGSRSIQETALVNSGAYPNLEITNFTASYVAPGYAGKRGGYFTITYTIRNCTEPSQSREEKTVVRLLNA